MSNDNNEHITLQQLMRDKLENAKRRFENEATEAEIKDKLDALTVEELTAHLISMRPMWDVLESKETHFFLSLMAGSADGDDHKAVMKVVDTISRMPEDKVALLWNYILWFLKCIKSTL